jgi:hypothetical protein
MTMTNLKTLLVPSIATVAFSLLGACAQVGDLDQRTQSIELSDPFGASRSVTVLDEHRGATEGYAEVRMGEREFSLAQWIDSASGFAHNLVTSRDGTIRYEYVADAGSPEVVVTDVAGSRVITPGDAMGTLDADAATLLMNFRSAAATLEGNVAYDYQTYCVFYDTSDPKDWYLYVASCTCAHWYSVFCTEN